MTELQCRSQRSGRMLSESTIVLWCRLWLLWCSGQLLVTTTAPSFPACYCLAVGSASRSKAPSWFMGSAAEASLREGGGVEEQRVARMPRPQTAATANLLLFHCFYDNAAGVLLSSKVKRWYTGWGGGVRKEEQVVGGLRREYYRKRMLGREKKQKRWGVLNQREHEEAERMCLLALSAGSSGCSGDAPQANGRSSIKRLVMPPEGFSCSVWLKYTHTAGLHIYAHSVCRSFVPNKGCLKVVTEIIRGKVRNLASLQLQALTFICLDMYTQGIYEPRRH